MEVKRVIRTVPKGHIEAAPDLVGPFQSILERASSKGGRRVRAGDRQSILVGLLRSGDALAAVAGAVIAYALRYGTAELAAEYWMFTFLGAVLLINYVHMMRSYEFDALRSFRMQAARTLLAWTAVIITLISLAYFLKLGESFSRIWFVVWFCSSAIIFVGTRLVGAALIARWRRNGQLARRVALIGARELVVKLAQRVAAADNAVVVTTVVLDHVGAPHEAGWSDIDRLLILVKSSQVDDIIVAPRFLPDAGMHELIRTLRILAVDVRLYTTGLEQPVPSGKLTVLYGLPLFSIAERPLTGWTPVAKRAEDLVISSVALVLALPLMIVIAIAIKLETRGPALFRQDRFGFDNNLIRVYKFRTMHHEPARERAVDQARRNDTRVTRVGRFLRQTSVDELPQLFNVLIGDMSLVGPRPHPVALNKKFAYLVDGYLARHRVKPGITGWAQVNGLRGETDTLEKMRRRVEHDLYYIDNWSLAFDLKILFFTIFVGFVHENAY